MEKKVYVELPPFTGRNVPITVYERFSSMRELERMGLEPDIDHYEVVYTAPLPPYKDQNTMLEELYAKFNVSHPDDFTGHSLSVSDIVALRQNGVVSCHYVDSIGFQELPGFLKPENYLKAAEMAMEDDYGMIDGVINNGKKEEPVEKASVLDQLKEKQEAVPPAPPRRCCEEKELYHRHTEHNRPVIMSELKTKAAHRDVPLPDCLAKCLREAKENSTSDYVVANSEGEPLSYTQFKRLWQYIVTRTVKERSYYRYENGKRVKHTVKPVLGERAAHNGKVVYSLIFERHANMKYKYGRRVFWAKGYYVNTVGGNEAKIRKYIQDQEAEDQMCDQLSFKEYEDPFKNADLDDDDSPEVPADSAAK